MENKPSSSYTGSSPIQREADSLALAKTILITGFILLAGFQTGFIPKTWKSLSVAYKESQIEQGKPDTTPSEAEYQKSREQLRKDMREALVNMLSAKTFYLSASYVDKSGAVYFYQTTNDRSNLATPITKGTITQVRTSESKPQKQILLFTAMRTQAGQTMLYFKMGYGREATNAPEFGYYGSQEDFRRLEAFRYFWDVDFGEINSLKGPMVVGNIPDGPAKQAYVEALMSDKMYLLSACGTGEYSRLWCTGNLKAKQALLEMQKLYDASGVADNNLATYLPFSDVQLESLTSKVPRYVRDIRITAQGKERTFSYSGINDAADIVLPTDYRLVP